MGIVVTIVMLFGLVILRPTPWRSSLTLEPNMAFVAVAIVSLLVCGLWNFLWFGLRHLSEFWGWAAIISGLAMILSAQLIITQHIVAQHSDRFNLLGTRLLKVKGVIISTLALSFVLYTVTIIQLNMGLPIIGR